MSDWVCGGCLNVFDSKLRTCSNCKLSRVSSHSQFAKQIHNQWPKDTLGWPPAQGEVVVDPQSNLFKNICKLCPEVTVTEIKKNENYTLFAKFIANRFIIHRECAELMQDAESAGNIDETDMYYHGSSADSIDKIMQTGFSIPCSSTGVLSLGRGAYVATEFPFAAWPKYARPDGNGEGQVVLSWATCGRTMLGSPAYDTAPRDQLGRRVHSTTQFVGDNARRYICLFDADQLYPAFRVKYVIPTDSICFL